MVSIRNILAAVVATAVAVSAASVENVDDKRMVKRLIPGNGLGGLVGTYEYSLHASHTNKHLVSCHFASLLPGGAYRTMPTTTEYTCKVATRKCKSNGVGAKQAFVKECIGLLGVPVFNGWN